MGDQFSHEIRLSAIILGATFIVFFGALYWLRGDISKRAADDADFSGQIASQAYAIGALASNKKDAVTAAAYQKAIDALIPPRDQILGFPDWLATQAQVWRVGLHFSFNGSEVMPQGDQPGYVDFVFDADGNPSDLAGFLKFLELQSSQYLLSANAVDIIGRSGSDTMNVQGRLFFK